jgi:hypothetical protein
MSLGKIASWVEESYRTFQEEVAGALDNKEFLLVEAGTADNSVKLNTGASPIGTMFQKLQPQTGRKDDINVRMFGGEGTLKVVQNAAINFGVKVIADPAAYTKVKALPATPGIYKVLGQKMSEGGGAAGDVIEISDKPETVVVPTVVVLGNTNGEIGSLNSTAVNPTKADFDALLLKTEELADDLRAMHAALVAQGQLLAA